jgi:hypothetical protein
VFDAVKQCAKESKVNVAWPDLAAPIQAQATPTGHTPISLPAVTVTGPRDKQCRQCRRMGQMT